MIFLNEINLIVLLACIIHEIILFRSQTALNKENARFSFLKIAKAISASLNSVLSFISLHFDFSQRKFINNAV